MQKIKILHIEDDLSDAILTRQLLNQSSGGAQDIVNVIRLSDALRELKQNDYQVVLLDLGLVDVSGLDNLRCIKEENPNIPIIVLTGNNNDKLAQQALTEGAQEFLFKGQSSPDILKRIIASSIVRKAAENELNRQLHYDPLTGLPNRLFFSKMVETLLLKAQRRGIREALMFIDLDGFKQVNDVYGHETGNHVLAVTAKRMVKALRCSDIVARYAGDEFIIYMDGKHDVGVSKEACATIAKKLISAVEMPIQYEGHNIEISLSIGISIFPDHGVTYADLIETADEAIYKAKRDVHSNYCFSDRTKNDMNVIFTEQSASKTVYH